MDNLYQFMDAYIKEQFDKEKLLKRSPSGTVARLRKKDSHKRYICRRYVEPVQIYEDLVHISCDHLPRVFECAKEPDGRRMIVLEEFIPGDTLSLLLERGPLSSGQTRNIAIQLCKALHVLHSLGWIHRDIKPDNVLIYGDRTVLTDFDAARSPSTLKTQDTRILGTVGYAPPEQYGISETDERADIYAMGVLINVMLTGEHPSQTLAAGRWGSIVSRCTMINPDKRYDTVQRLLEAL